jgi:vitamin B12 transporter
VKDISRDGFVSGLDASGNSTVNLVSSYELTNNWSIFARVEYLFDRHYENPVGFLQPSVGVFAGVKSNFR